MEAWPDYNLSNLNIFANSYPDPNHNPNPNPNPNLTLKMFLNYSPNTFIIQKQIYTTNLLH